MENLIFMNFNKNKVIQIKGDASFRKFYRIILKKGSRIIVYSQKEKYKNLIAYSAVNKFLKKNKINSPKLFYYNLQNNMIVVEDFGDLTFNKILLKQKNKFSTYKKLVDLLIKIQKIKPQKKIKNILKKNHVIKKYSARYLHKESDLFFKWYLPLFLEKKKISGIKKKLRTILSKLYKSLNLPNKYFVHRDFHAQNLMKVGKKIGVIDSQDALIGNPAYDLVSLIDDVRIRTSKELKDKIYKYYVNKALKNYKANNQKFLNDFNILSVQRSLKIIGIFSRLYKRDQKSDYLKFIPYAWHLLEMRMNSVIFLKLRKILDSNISKNVRKRIYYK